MRFSLPLFLILVLIPACGESEPATPEAEKAPAQAEEPTVPGALTNAEIDAFIDVQTVYMNTSRELREEGIGGAAASAEMERVRGEALIKHGFTHQTWSELYRRIKDTLTRLDRGQVAGLLPAQQADNLLVAKRRQEIEAAIYSNR